MNVCEQRLDRWKRAQQWLTHVSLIALALARTTRAGAMPCASALLLVG